MLDIINNLTLFFEDNYVKINVRRYSRIMKISPPTASKLLKKYEEENLLESSKYERYIFFNAKRDNKDFIDLSRIYWRNKLKELVSFLIRQSASEPTIILFGSLSKAEAKKDSDVDLAVISPNNLLSNLKDTELAIFERSIGRKVEIFDFKSLSEASKLPIWKAILNGYVLSGRL